MFSGGGLRGKMMRRMAGMTGWKAKPATTRLVGMGGIGGLPGLPCRFAGLVAAEEKEKKSDAKSFASQTTESFRCGTVPLPGSSKRTWREEKLLAIRLMRMGAKKRPSYRIVVKEKQSKRDGASWKTSGRTILHGSRPRLSSRPHASVIGSRRARQPTDTVRQLIKQAAKAESRRPRKRRQPSFPYV